MKKKETIVKMDWRLFKKEASRTFAVERFSGWNMHSTDHQKLNQLHCVIGISTEIIELMDAIVKKDDVNVKEEIGDILWYTANLERLIGVRSKMPYDTKGIQVFPDEWLVGNTELLDHYKKAVYYGADVDKEYVGKHIEQIKKTCCGLAYNGSADIDDIMQLNVDKLKARYPEKFTQEHAQHRDLDKEREVLEGGGDA
mgnify:CR=1 FL=1